MKGAVPLPSESSYGCYVPFSDLTGLVGWQKGHMVHKNYNFTNFWMILLEQVEEEDPSRNWFTQVCLKTADE